MTFARNKNATVPSCQPLFSPCIDVRDELFYANVFLLFLYIFPERILAKVVTPAIFIEMLYASLFPNSVTNSKEVIQGCLLQVFVFYVM